MRRLPYSMCGWFMMFLVTLSFADLTGQASICTGSLGENIFIEGDFGSGPNTILPTDPGIAPGYVYERSPPPEDGFYNITNNTGDWSFNYNTWLNIGDNSSDPDGYMMVVNASFTAGLFYDQEVTGLCENTLYVFSADVINMIRMGVTNHILPDVSFLIDGQEAFASGAIPQDETWHTYGFTFTTNPGQTSVQLSLRNNAPGGIGNDLALDNISFRPCGPGTFILPEEVANICEDGDPIVLEATIEGDQYDTPQIQWQESLDEGQSWSNIPGATSDSIMHTNLMGGFYYYRFLLANSVENLNNARCRSISNVKVVHVIPKLYMVIDSICEGLTYTFGTRELNTSGTYVDSLFTVIGCDSIVTLDLTIVPDTDIQAEWETIDPSCHDTQDGQLNVLANPSWALPIEVTIDEMHIDSNLTGLSAGNYNLLLRDRYGCQFNGTISLNEPEPFIIEIGNDTVIPVGSNFTIVPNANYPVASTQWMPLDLSCDDPCDLIEWIPTSDVQVSVVATSDNLCMAGDSFNITVVQDRTVHFPNIFSPNGDGINDFFSGYGRQPNVQMIESLKIFDRWGNLLHTENQLLPNSNTGWDGRVHGDLLDTGVYIYQASVRFLDGAVFEFSGDVTLVR